MTAQQAIAKSTKTDTTVTMDYNSLERDVLASKCAGSVRGNDVDEFWGASEAGEWRVHMHRETKRRPKKEEAMNDQLTAVQLDVCLKKMQMASDNFYMEAVHTGNHAFIEFAGLMNEYIKVCTDAALKGVDFTKASVHTGKRLEFKDYQIKYLAEKLDCIYGEGLLAKAVYSMGEESEANIRS